MSRFSFHSYLLNFTPLFCLPIHFHFIFISFSFPFDYRVWAWTQLASHFLQYLLVDQLYVKKVYFCSFVTKSNQAFTKYSPVVFNSFYRTVTHGGLYIGFSQASPSSIISPRFILNLFLLLPLYFFFHCSPLSPLQRIYKISIDPDKPPHTAPNKISFLEIFIFLSLLEHSPVHAVSINPNIPPLRESGLQQIYL